MKRISRLVAVLLALCGAMWALLFCLGNAQVVPLDLVLLSLPPAPLGVWVLGAFVTGGVAGLLASSAALWRGRRA